MNLSHHHYLTTAAAAAATTTVVLIFTILSTVSARTFTPTTSTEFQSSLDTVQPGDTIELQPIDYHGDFIINRNGLAHSPITLFGHYDASKYTEPEPAAVDKPSNETTPSPPPPPRPNSTNIFCTDQTAFTIQQSSYWTIKNLNITCPDESIVLQQSTQISLISLAIQNSRTAIYLENSDSNLLGSISISDSQDGILVQGNSNNFRDISCSNVKTGLIIEQGDKNKLHNLVVHDQTKSVTTGLLLSSSTCCGVLTNTIFSGLVEIDGNGYSLRQMIVHGAVNVRGCNNTFVRSIFDQVWFNEECGNRQLSQNIYHIVNLDQVKEV